MRRERVCPICGGNMEQRMAEPCGEASTYGRRLSMELRCDDADCGFGLAFPFDAEVYCAYACEEICRLTAHLPADRRADALLASMSYCREDPSDALSTRLLVRIEEIFERALREILQDAQTMVRALSYREPSEKKRDETRRDLQAFLRFLEHMQGRYPSEAFEKAFEKVYAGLQSIDSLYELGMLHLEDDLSMAEDCFLRGMQDGRVRSGVAYVKHVLADVADSEEEREELKRSFAELAPQSQEACYEYVKRAEIGVDPILDVLSSYETASYVAVANDARIAFIRLELTVCIEHLEPMLAALQALSTPTRGDGSPRARRILEELEALTLTVTAQCEELLRPLRAGGRGTGSQSDLLAERIALSEENALLEFVIGCCMYHRSILDFEKHFDLAYLREASGHFYAFLASDLMRSVAPPPSEVLQTFRSQDRAPMRIEPSSVIGVQNLPTLAGTAERYVRALRKSAGLRGG